MIIPFRAIHRRVMRDDDDEALAREARDEEAEAARITGANRAAMRARDEAIARDEAYARRLQQEEDARAVFGAFGDGGGMGARREDAEEDARGGGAGDEVLRGVFLLPLPLLILPSPG